MSYQCITCQIMCYICPIALNNELLMYYMKNGSSVMRYNVHYHSAYFVYNNWSMKWY
jgi:hypothetical protein